eukprot:365321-Chlamydomonas_euryale.AAC.22
MCPVSVSRSCAVARSQILIVRSADPVANHSLPGSTATLRTQPKWPDTTRYSLHGACHAGRGHLEPRRRLTAAELLPLSLITSMTARCLSRPAALSYTTTAADGEAPDGCGAAGPAGKLSMSLPISVLDSGRDCAPGAGAGAADGPEAGPAVAQSARA